MEEVHLTTIKPKNNVLLLAQEISFAKVLACNDKRLRDRGLRRLKKWFVARSQGSIEFSKDDFMRLWKGLFYCMWMSDKPLVQEDLAEEISKLIHSFATFKTSLLFVETFFASLSIEWFGIDQLRLDKYLMLVRRFVRQSLQLVAKLGWPEAEVQQVADVYHHTLSSAPMGLSMHIIEVFCEELAKVGNGELSSPTILQFVTVFAKIMANLKDGRLISQITRCVFLHLMRQTEPGIEHHVKEQVWKEYGFPGGDIDAVEKNESDSDEEGTADEMEQEEAREVGIDARAGNVDVSLPPLDFDFRELLSVLRDLRNKKETTTKARKTLMQLITKYEHLAAGKYPLGLHKVDLPTKVGKKKEIAQAAKRLMLEDEKLRSDEDSETELRLNKVEKRKKKILKPTSSTWEVSEGNESKVNTEAEANSSWSVSEAVNKISKKKHPSKKRKMGEEQISGKKPKKSKSSQFLVSDSEENSFSQPQTSTPKERTQNFNVSQFSVIDSKNNSILCQDEKVQNQKNKSTDKNVASENIKTLADENQTPVRKNKNFKNKKLVKQTKTQQRQDSSIKFETTEIQSPEVDSTTDLQLNTSTTDKNNGWGGEWEEPSPDTEYEIFIPNKKYVEKRKSLGLPYPVSSFVQKSAEKLTPVNKLKRELQNKSLTPGSQKKVEFNLSANKAQEYKEYAKKLKFTKSQVPFDASKKPMQGLLKNSTPSPINPFYQND